MRTRVVDAVLATALVAVVVSGFCYTWTPMSPTSFFGALSMSADGRIVCVCPSTSGQLRISRDSGQTWSIATNAPPGGSLSGSLVALSADGSQIIACLSSNGGFQGLVCCSTDFGTNWTTLGLPILPGPVSYCVACSANGSNVIAGAEGGPLYFSTTGGSTWSTASAPNTNWWSLASSASGQRMAAAVSGGQIYFSTNFGAAWTPTNLPAQSWKAVCVSADGQSVGATGTNSYISRNAGASWITNSIAGNTIACSANGTTWMIVGVQAYTSSDGGVTWSTNFSNSGYGAMSADGCEVVVSASSTNWLGRITPAPQLNLQATNDNLGISWLLPSTNFVLQQNSDLNSTNWETVSTAPTLNFTNLQQEVTVPATGSNTFFRLIAQ